MKTYLVLSLPSLLLLGCATPQQRCITEATRDMAVVDQLIAETEGTLQRGFALQTETIYHTDFQDCTAPVTPQNPNPAPRMCPVEVPSMQTKPLAVDLNAERSKLGSLQAKRDQQGKAAHAAVAQCRAIHPK